MIRPKSRLCLRIDIAVYLLFAVFGFWMAAQIPYTHDDWDWGLQVGMQHLLTADINSRYAGNFLIVLMSRSEILKTLIMGTFFFLLPWLLSGLAARNRGEDREEKRLLFFLIAAGLVFTMSREIWQQTCGWVSGFANYVISAAFLLLCAGEWILALEDTRMDAVNPGRSIFFFLVSILGQMFLENLSLFLTAASVLVCIIYRKKTGHVSRHLVWMAVGMAVGLVLMFSSPIYAPLFQTGFAVNEVRRMSVNAAAGIGGSVYNILFQCAVLAIRCGEMNVVCAILALALLAVAACRREAGLSGGRKAVICCGNLTFAVYFVISQLMNTQYSSVSTLRVLFAAFVNAAYLVAVALEIWCIFKGSKALAWKLLAFWMGGLAILMPLIATSENGHRVFFTYLVCIMLFDLTLLNELLKNSGKRENTVLILLCALCVAALLGYYGTVYSAIGSCKRERDRILAEQAQTQADSIILPQYPYDTFLWFPDPSTQERDGYFREFYGIDKQTNIIVDIRYP